LTQRLILKRANASRSSGQWKENDFDVLADGKVVGRILESGSPDLLWTWSITAIVPASRATHSTQLGKKTTRAR
jgi:hypothetical protein